MSEKEADAITATDLRKDADMYVQKYLLLHRGARIKIQLRI